MTSMPPAVRARAEARVALAALATALAGCASAPLDGVPAPAVPEVFRESAPDRAERDAATAAAAAPADGWWRAFEAPELDAWVARAAQANPGVQQAAARTAAARAALLGVAASSSPLVTAGVGATRRTGAWVNAAGEQGNLFSADVDLQLDVDPLRRAGRAEQAARHDVALRQALEREAMLALQAELAQAWLQWRGAQAEAPLLQQLLQAHQDLVAQLDRRVRAGLATQADLVPARERLRDDEADRQRLSRRQAQALHALAAAVGDPALPAPPAPAPDAGLPPLPRIDAGLPATLLKRRADIAAADAALQAARLRLGLARDAWFPSLTLTASTGLASADLGQWLKAAARSTGLGLLLALPVFDGGRADAARQAAQAEVQRAAAEHRQRVLQALRDVDDQLALLRTLDGEAALRRAALADAQADEARARSRRSHGLAAEVDTLQARVALLRQQRALLQVELAQRQATVALVQALGGGWGREAALPAARVAWQADVLR